MTAGCGDGGEFFQGGAAGRAAGASFDEEDAWNGGGGDAGENAADEKEKDKDTDKEQNFSKLECFPGEAAKGEVGKEYAHKLEPKGGSANFTFATDNLPKNGLKLEGAKITGTPEDEETFTVAITVEDLTTKEKISCSLDIAVRKDDDTEEGDPEFDPSLYQLSPETFEALWKARCGVDYAVELSP